MQRLRRLLRRSSARSTERAFVAEGIKVVAAGLDAGVTIESVYVAAEGRDTPAVVEIVDRALGSGARVFDLGAGIMERVADTVTPQPVCAIIGELDVPLAVLLSPPAGSRGGGQDERLVLVCVDVRDPGNLGAVIRSAAGAGASGVVCCEGTADPFNPKTVRATAGAIFGLPISLAASPPEAFSALGEAGFRLVATTAHEGTDYALADLSGDIALVLGNEASGLPKEVVEALDECVTIPMAPGTESLNVAMTATVLCYEISRRRRLS
ncbi:MAG: TrmH family RNA methyltransferase [Acidimicrobiales bacterium]